MTIARKLVDLTHALRYEALPPHVTHQVKRVLIDALGCCIGAFKADATQIVHRVIEEFSGPRESTVIGSGFKTHCLNAALVNGIMVRYLDYNDLYVVPAGPWYVASHPSDAIPGILAVAERTHSSGPDVIAAIVTAYELSARFCHSTTSPPLATLGWNEDSRGVLITPLAVGRLLQLNDDELENAVGISGCQGMVLGILDTGGEEYSMSKSLRYHRTAYEGILATLLAKKGFTGPTTVIEGSNGFIQTVLRGACDVHRLATLGDHYYINDVDFKSLCAVGAVQGHLSATLDLVKKHNIVADDVASVTITAGTRPIEHTGDPAKKYPTNKETADHSSYYLTAAAIIDRAVGPEQYEAWKFTDPKVIELIDKVSLRIDKEMDKIPRSGKSEIVLKNGRRFVSRVDYPKGQIKNPMSDEDLEAKFTSMASKVMDDRQIRAILDTIYRLDTLPDVGALMQPLVFK